MFAVIFEVQPRADQWNAYLDYAKMLRPELVKIDGFLDNVRYRSKRRAGWVLSLSTWRDEKAFVRWRTLSVHHTVQEKGRFEVFEDYHLRVGQVTHDNRALEDLTLHQQRLDETEVGTAKLVSMVELECPALVSGNTSATEIAIRLGLCEGADGLVDWDLFEAILTPGLTLLLLSWRDVTCASASERGTIPDSVRHRRVRILRDYGMFDRREAPQYFPDVEQQNDATSTKLP